MAKKPVVRFVCSNCGAVHSAWAGRCSECGEWNTLEEEVTTAISAVPGGSLLPGHALLTSTVDISAAKDQARLVSGIDEADTVFGGGIVDESPIYALLANSGFNPIDLLYASDQFHQASLRLTSHVRSSPSSCPSPIHPPTYPNT